MLRVTRGPLIPVLVTLTGREPESLQALVTVIETPSMAAWLVESRARSGRKHVHGIACVARADLESWAALEIRPSVHFDVPSGYPSSWDVLRGSLERFFAYVLRVRDSGDETPIRAWGKGELLGAAGAAHAFLRERAELLGRVCACGCGEPLAPGRRQYATDQCAARARQRARRDRARILPSSGAATLDEAIALLGRATEILKVLKGTK